ncbi:MAG: tRNA (N6-threonylcarbamoyladenosine(37)-N6)-methyltransferase TrmO [Clostridiales bacterium]|nr:tRNA (N6-threonylcarbamoyladenosine(37)-N6)-methyltransferase TrmO [Clostridiales bacterium]
MVRKEIRFRPIGRVHSPFKAREDIDPLRNVRPNGLAKVEGELEIFKPYAAGLKDIDGFSHLIVIFAFHRSQKVKLLVKPPRETRRRGVFSTRSPHRPNPIGLTIVRLLGRRKNILQVSGMDMLDETPILDIKPYTPRDSKRRLKHGWLEERSKKKKKN